MRNVPIDVVSSLKDKCDLSLVNLPFQQLPITRKIFYFLADHLSSREEVISLYRDLYGYGLKWPQDGNDGLFLVHTRYRFDFMFCNIELETTINRYVQLLKRVSFDSPHSYSKLDALLDRFSVRKFSIDDATNIDEAIKDLALIDNPTILLLDIGDCNSVNNALSVIYSLDFNVNVFPIFTSTFEIQSPEFDFIELPGVDFVPLVFVEQEPMLEAS